MKNIYLVPAETRMLVPIKEAAARVAAEVRLISVPSEVRRLVIPVE